MSSRASLRLSYHRGTTAHVASIYPFSVQGSFGHRGTYVGLDLLAGGSEFCWDPFEAYAAGLVTNPNGWVLGEPGNGKSALVKCLLWRQAAVYGAGKPVAAAVYGRVCSLLAAFGPFEVRTTKSQIAFRRKRGFAYLWLPGQYLSKADAEVVLSTSGAVMLRSGSQKSPTPPRDIGCTILSSMGPMKWTARCSTGSARPSLVLADRRPSADREPGKSCLTRH